MATLAQLRPTQLLLLGLFGLVVSVLLQLTLFQATPALAQADERPLPRYLRREEPDFSWQATPRNLTAPDGSWSAQELELNGIRWLRPQDFSQGSPGHQWTLRCWVVTPLAGEGVRFPRSATLYLSPAATPADQGQLPLTEIAVGARIALGSRARAVVLLDLPNQPIEFAAMSADGFGDDFEAGSQSFKGSRGSSGGSSGFSSGSQHGTDDSDDSSDGSHDLRGVSVSGDDFSDVPSGANDFGDFSGTDHSSKRFTVATSSPGFSGLSNSFVFSDFSSALRGGVGETMNRSEERLLAHTWARYATTGDPEQLLLFPMVKAVVKTLDAVQEWLSSDSASAANHRAVNGEHPDNVGDLNTGDQRELNNNHRNIQNIEKPNNQDLNNEGLGQHMNGGHRQHHHHKLKHKLKRNVGYQNAVGTRRHEDLGSENLRHGNPRHNKNHHNQHTGHDSQNHHSQDHNHNHSDDENHGRNRHDNTIRHSNNDHSNNDHSNKRHTTPFPSHFNPDPHSNSQSRSSSTSATTPKTTQRLHPERWLVTGSGSLRGWTAWLASLDRRVVAVAPITWDLLNLYETFGGRPTGMLGGWPQAMEAWCAENTTQLVRTPVMRQLAAILDPLEYPVPLTSVSKLVVSAAGDEMFAAPDLDRSWWAKLPGPKKRLVIENDGHGLGLGGAEVALNGVVQFAAQMAAGGALPVLEWAVDERDGSISLVVVRGGRSRGEQGKGDDNGNDNGNDSDNGGGRGNGNSVGGDTFDYDDRNSFHDDRDSVDGRGIKVDGRDSVNRDSLRGHGFDGHDIVGDNVNFGDRDAFAGRDSVGDRYSLDDDDDDDDYDGDGDDDETGTDTFGAVDPTFEDPLLVELVWANSVTPNNPGVRADFRLAVADNPSPPGIPCRLPTLPPPVNCPNPVFWNRKQLHPIDGGGGSLVYKAFRPPPLDGWDAFFIRLEYPGGQVFTTQVSVVPVARAPYRQCWETNTCFPCRTV